VAGVNAIPASPVAPFRTKLGVVPTRIFTALAPAGTVAAVNTPAGHANSVSIGAWPTPSPNRSGGASIFAINPDESETVNRW
jgi:hypothetical protein